MFRVQTLALAMLATVGAFAQTGQTGSISGVVRDADSGKPLAGVRVTRGSADPDVLAISATIRALSDDLQALSDSAKASALGVLPNPRRRDSSTVTTDSQGRYTLSQVPIGEVSVIAITDAGVQASRTVNLTRRQELSSIDLRVSAAGQISGMITSDDGSPLEGISVLLITREYWGGALSQVPSAMRKTGKDGRYVFERVATGRGYLVLARQQTASLDPISNAPADAELRERILTATYYPGADRSESAVSIALAPSEKRDLVDIRMTKSIPYCIEGQVRSSSAPELFRLQVAEPSIQYRFPSLPDAPVVEIAAPSALTPLDGKFRICGFTRGDYEITAETSRDRAKAGPSSFGAESFAITDHDIRNLIVSPAPRSSLQGEVAWDKATSGITSMAPTILSLPGVSIMITTIPVRFSFPSVDAPVAAQARVHMTPPQGAYVKDITYGGLSVLRGPLNSGGGDLRIVLARDGGRIATEVVDKDGHAVPGASVVVIPADANSEAALAESMASGIADSQGAWLSGSLAPGKYYVLAGSFPGNRSFETIGRLWQARGSAEKVEVEPGATVRVRLEMAGR